MGSQQFDVIVDEPIYIQISHNLPSWFEVNETSQNLELYHNGILVCEISTDE